MWEWGRETRVVGVWVCVCAPEHWVQRTRGCEVPNSYNIYLYIYRYNTPLYHVMCPSINPHFLPFGDHSSYVRLYMFAIASLCVCIVEWTSAKKIIDGERGRETKSIDADGFAYKRRRRLRGSCIVVLLCVYWAIKLINYTSIYIVCVYLCVRLYICV